MHRARKTGDYSACNGAFRRYSPSFAPSAGSAVRADPERFQRVLRIGLRWYINPIVEQQNAFNDAAVAALFELEMENQRLRRALDEHARSDAGDSTAS